MIQKSTCHEHNAVNNQNTTRTHLDATGIGAVACGRHGCFYPHAVVNFQKGEGSVFYSYFASNIHTFCVYPQATLHGLCDLACDLICCRCSICSSPLWHCLPIFYSFPILYYHTSWENARTHPHHHFKSVKSSYCWPWFPVSNQVFVQLVQRCRTDRWRGNQVVVGMVE